MAWGSANTPGFTNTESIQKSEQHIVSSVNSKEGVHDLRVYNGVTQRYNPNSEKWEDLANGVNGAILGLDSSTVYMDSEDVNNEGNVGEGKLIFGVLTGSSRVLDIPTITGTRTYTGNNISIMNYLLGYSVEYMELDGDLVVTDAGDYIVNISLKENCVWSDGTSGTKSLPFTVERAEITRPTLASSTYPYTGGVINVSLENLNENTVVLSGIHSATTVGNRVAKVSPDNNHKWSEGDPLETISFNWGITASGVVVPTLETNNFTYTGSPLSPEVSYSSSHVKLTGDLSATDAGTYTITASLLDPVNTRWSDGTSDPKSLTWHITQINSSLFIAPTSLSFDKMEDQTVSVTTTSTGAVTASSEDSTIATPSVNGKSVIVTPKKDGNTRILIGVNGDTNHAAPTSIYCPVVIDTIISATKFNQLAITGGLQSYYDEGDTVDIFLGSKSKVSAGGTTNNGSTDPLSQINGLYGATILEFDHQASGDQHYVDLQFGVDSSGKLIAWPGFAVHLTQASSDYSEHMPFSTTTMALVYLPGFYDIIDSEWKSNIIPVTRYYHNTFYETPNEPLSYNLMSWLLSEINVFGTRTAGASSEENYNSQYTAYRNGMGKIRNNALDLDSPLAWWLETKFPYNSNATGLATFTEHDNDIKNFLNEGVTATINKFASSPTYSISPFPCAGTLIEEDIEKEDYSYMATGSGGFVYEKYCGVTTTGILGYSQETNERGFSPCIRIGKTA